MATAYVTVTGTAAYPGSLINPTSLTNALAGAGAGDTIYIAPGNYTGVSNVTYAGASGSSGSPVRFIGDATGSVFSTTAGPIRITAAANISTGTGNQILTFANNSWIEWSYVIFDRITPSSNALTLTTCQNFTFSNCIFYGAITATNSAAAPWSHTFQRCAFFGAPCYQTTLSSTNSTTTPWVFTNCIFMPVNIGSAARAILINSGAGAGGSITNCLFYGAEIVNFSSTWSTSNPIAVKNCLFASSSAIFNQTTNGMVCSYNRYTFASLTGVSAGTGSTTGGILGSDMFESLLFGISAIQPYSSVVGSPNTSFGNATNAPIADMYGVTWSGVSPDAGPATYRTIGGVSPYLPSERNASTITIAPGSTSQSIELYLGATGLTASTSGLSARYNRTRTASVNIPLVARTIAQAWTAGGFAEVDATNMPGVYRLDVPDAALAAGADDVTIVVRGASGTNGAVMTVKLSSGGLTEAQTASAVWDASPAGYNDATTFGGVVNQIDQTVTSIDTEVQDIPSNVWDELKANHTIPNSFGDYLDTKVSTGADTSRIQLRQGPFLIKQNAIDSVITEVNQFLSTVPNIEMVLIDSSGGSVSVAGATLVMRVRNQAGTAVVNNVTPTVAYADGGVIRWSPNLSWTALGVTTVGTYRIVVERTMSGVTTTFGPFLVQLSSG